MGQGFLRRYTIIPALIYLLKNRAITLLDPKSWGDRNDSHYLSVYKKEKALKSVLALCFTTVGERYHHWHVFAGGPSGVCIAFKRDNLLDALKGNPGIKCGPVQYLTLKSAQKRAPRTDRLPFLKRYAFRDESEFRVIFGSKKTQASTMDIPILLSSIEKISLSPWIPESLSESLKETLRSFEGCEDLRISRSTLVNNPAWKSLVGGPA